MAAGIDCNSLSLRFSCRNSSQWNNAYIHIMMTIEKHNKKQKQNSL